MPTSLVKGQKIKLADLGASEGAFEVGVRIAPGGAEAVDVSCFGVDATGKLSDDRFFIFYNQKQSPGGALTMQGPRGADGEIFALDLSKLPATIERLVFTATLDGADTMSGLRASHWRLLRAGQTLAEFAFSGADFGAEKAIMVAEIYRKDDVWLAAAVGQGFNGGLSALLAHFGGEEIKSTTPSPVAAPPPPPPVPTVRLSKVTLEKQGASKMVSLRKDGGSQPITINLNWNKQTGGVGGFFGMGKSSGGSADLDLGCMYLMRDGSKYAIQPIGGYFGSRTEPPYIFLDKDDRTGAAADGENLTIFRPDLIEQVLVFAMIYEGTANFSHVNARLLIREQDGDETTIQLNNPDPARGFCAICLIRRVAAGVEVVKEERYFQGHRDADQHYKFGFQWTQGSK